MEDLRNKDGLTEKEFLEQYKVGDFERPSVTVDMLLFTIDTKSATNIRQDNKKELKILLIKRKNHPHIHKWALPGGFVNMTESVEEAAYRELEEETHISNVYMEQLYTFGEPNRDIRTRVISSSYMALIPKESVKPVAGDDAEDVAWFTISKEPIFKNDVKIVYRLTIENDDIQASYHYRVEERLVMNGKIPMRKSSVYAETDKDNKLAFDHIEQINMALDRLKNKVEYTPIIFNLLPEKFTLNDLQELFEIILGKDLVKQNFRVKISKYVESLDEVQENVGHRPAKLYKLKDLKINEVG